MRRFLAVVFIAAVTTSCITDIAKWRCDQRYLYPETREPCYRAKEARWDNWLGI